MILELSDQDNVALEEISKILERHPDLKLIEMVVEPTLIFNHLIIDTGKRKVYYNQQEVLLTTKEYELCRLFLYGEAGGFFAFLGQFSRSKKFF